MYQSHFGFQRQPFVAGDALRNFFESASVQTAIPQISHALRSDPGVAVLTGPAGCGKSTLLRHLQQKLALDGRACFCSAASLESPRDLLQFLESVSCSGGGQDTRAEKETRTEWTSRWAVREKLHRACQFWGPVQLLLDDAHLLPTSVLHELKSLVDDGGDFGPILRTLIAGPLSLEELLARPTHIEFGHRVRCHAFLEPFTALESSEYLRQQIESLGVRPGNVLTREAVEMITRASEGLPRNLNLLTDESLLEAAERDLTCVDADCVKAAFRRLVHLPCDWNSSGFSDQSGSDDLPLHDHVDDSATVETDCHSASTVVEFGGDHDGNSGRSTNVVELADDVEVVETAAAASIEVGVESSAGTVLEIGAAETDSSLSEDDLNEADGRVPSDSETAAADSADNEGDGVPATDDRLDLAPFEEPEPGEPIRGVGFASDLSDVTGTEQSDDTEVSVDIETLELLPAEPAADVASESSEAEPIALPLEPETVSFENAERCLTDSHGSNFVEKCRPVNCHPLQSMTNCHTLWTMLRTSRHLHVKRPSLIRSPSKRLQTSRFFRC